MVYLLAKRIPEISDAIGDHQTPSGFLKKFDKLLSAFPFDKVDVFATQFLEKALRKLRVYLLGFDNFLIKHLEKFKRMKKIQYENREKKMGLFKNGNGENNDIIKKDDSAEQ